MSWHGLEHPEITSAIETGYPSWKQEETIICEFCEESIVGDVYEDNNHEFLCLHCLKELHAKDGW